MKILIFKFIKVKMIITLVEVRDWIKILYDCKFCLHSLI